MNEYAADRPRVLRVEGAYNVRDLGGYRSRDGRSTRWGAFYRADGLYRLTQEGKRTIENLGVRAIVDMRHERELQGKRNVFDGDGSMRYFNIGLMNPTAPVARRMDSLGDLYVSLLEDCQPALRGVFETLAGVREGGALFHCAVGKDRTGVVAALLLDLADVPRETIVADYALTAKCIQPMMAELRWSRPSMVPEDEYESFLGCDPRNMLTLLEHLEYKYGNATGYMHAIGMPHGQVLALKERLLEN